jgi:hypothetical protein
MPAFMYDGGQTEVLPSDILVEADEHVELTS